MKEYGSGTLTNFCREGCSRQDRAVCQTGSRWLAQRTCIAVPNKTYASPVFRESLRTRRTSTGSSPCEEQRGWQGDKFDSPDRLRPSPTRLEA